MARSAAQRAARRLRRQMLPAFPFMRLPPELQLLVLCKCDLISVGRLLQVSPHLGILFSQYPETSLRDILQQIPTPVANLMRVSCALHFIENDDFDHDKTLSLLDGTDIIQWPCLFTRLLPSDGDPIDTIETMVQLCDEIDTITEWYAQSTNATVEAFRNPWVQAAPITLSSTEYIRIASTFWLLRIFYQLQLKFIHCGCKEQFLAIILKRWRPWQIEQARSVDYSLVQAYRRLRFSHDDDNPLDMMVRNSSFYQNMGEVYVGGSQLGAFSKCRNPIHDTNVHSARAFSLYLSHGSTSLIASDRSLQEGTSLRNHGWFYYTSVVGTLNLMFPPENYHSFFLNLGMFFWGQDRLIDWDLADPDSYHSTSKALVRTQYPVHTIAGQPKERYIEDRIRQWTRCSIPCTFEEWLYQPVALASDEAGSPSFPLIYLRPCGSCGFIGHIQVCCPRR